MYVPSEKHDVRVPFDFVRAQPIGKRRSIQQQTQQILSLRTAGFPILFALRNELAQVIFQLSVGRFSLLERHMKISWQTRNLVHPSRGKHTRDSVV